MPSSRAINSLTEGTSPAQPLPSIARLQPLTPRLLADSCQQGLSSGCPSTWHTLLAFMTPSSSSFSTIGFALPTKHCSSQLPPSPALCFSTYIFSISLALERESSVEHQASPQRAQCQTADSLRGQRGQALPIGVSGGSRGKPRPPGLSSHVPSPPRPLLSAWERSCPSGPSSQGLCIAAARHAYSTSAPTPPPRGLALCQAPADFNTSLFN